MGPDAAGYLQAITIIYYGSLIAYDPRFIVFCSSANLTCIALSSSVGPKQVQNMLLSLPGPDGCSPPPSYSGITQAVAGTAPSADLHSIAV